MKKTILILLLCLHVICQQAQTYAPDQWMRQLWSSIGSKPLNKVVFPGACRTGLNRLVFGTAVPEMCSTQSQDTTVYGLLCRGARYLDLTLVCSRDSLWNLGYCNYSSLLGMQLAMGQSLTSAISDINLFANDPRHTGEIIIINITAYADTKIVSKPKSPYGDLNAAKKEKLLEKLYSAFDYMLYKELLTPTVTINQVLGSVQKTQDKAQKTSAVILLFNDAHTFAKKYPGIVRSDSCGNSADLIIKTQYYKTVKQNELESQWTGWGNVNPGNCFKVMQWVLTWRSTDNKCNKQLAAGANLALEELLESKKLSFYPQVISTFFFSESLTQSIARLNKNLK